MPKLDLYRERLICVNHQQRPGYGICRRCKTVLCSECATFLEGVLTCPSCIHSLAEKQDVGLVAVGDSTVACFVVLAISLAGSILSLYGMTHLLRF